MTKNTQILVIGILVFALVCVSSGLTNDRLKVSVGGVPVPITWQIKGDAIYTTDTIEGTPNGVIINGVLYNPAYPESEL